MVTLLICNFFKSIHKTSVPKILSSSVASCSLPKIVYTTPYIRYIRQPDAIIHLLAHPPFEYPFGIFLVLCNVLCAFLAKASALATDFMLSCMNLCPLFTALFTRLSFMFTKATKDLIFYLEVQFTPRSLNSIGFG